MILTSLRPRSSRSHQLAAYILNASNYFGRIPEDVDAGGAIAEAASDQSRAESRGADRRHSGPRQEPMGPSAQR